MRSRGDGAETGHDPRLAQGEGGAVPSERVTVKGLGGNSTWLRLLCNFSRGQMTQNATKKRLCTGWT